MVAWWRFCDGGGFVVVWWYSCGGVIWWCFCDPVVVFCAGVVVFL